MSSSTRMNSWHYLLVEDEHLTRSAMACAVRDAGHTLEEAGDGITGLQLALEKNYDAIILDLGLPGQTGLDVLRQVRRVKRTPVLFVSQADQVELRLEALQEGGDDFLVKPIDMRELLVRLANLVTRSHLPPVSAIRQMGSLEIDHTLHQVSLRGNPVELTTTEYDLLVYLSRIPGRLVPRTELEELLFRGIPAAGRKANILDVYILRLRKKLGRELVTTRRGLGFILNG
ncbi:MAG: response regulator transcription factor [Planctomycetota bacterium]|nr:response regulator transcription factor [Planctomycetota bacterium]